MRFFKYDDNDEAGFEISSDEEKLIETKAVELKKLCYEFKCCDFETVVERMGYDEEIKCDFTAKQVADKLGVILPFVKGAKKKLLELDLFDDFLRKIETKTHDVIVSVIDSQISKNDIELDLFKRIGRNDYKEIIDAFFTFCDRETAYKVYDYLNVDDDED